MRICALRTSALLRCLFQVIIEVAADALMQVHRLVPAHVVRLAWVDEEVGLGAGFNAGLEERQGVPRYAGLVVVADDNLEAVFRFFAFGMSDEWA